MKADAICDDCGALVRRTTAGLIDPTPDPEGTAWVVAYRDGMPEMGVVADDENVPRSEPLRYHPHRC